MSDRYCTSKWNWSDVFEVKFIYDTFDGSRSDSDTSWYDDALMTACKPICLCDGALHAVRNILEMKYQQEEQLRGVVSWSCWTMYAMHPCISHGWMNNLRPGGRPMTVIDAWRRHVIGQPCNYSKLIYMYSCIPCRQHLVQHHQQLVITSS